MKPSRVNRAGSPVGRAGKLQACEGYIAVHEPRPPKRVAVALWIHLSLSFIVRKMQGAMCMLMIERRGEQYWVQFLPTNDQFSAFALPPTSFPDMHSLTHFLRNTLQVPQEVIDKDLQNGFIPLAPAQIERWPA
jgi:hypothetical protein